MTALPLRPASPPATGRGAGTAAATVVIEGLTYRYPVWSDLPETALLDVELALGPGLTVVEGDSGSGKSTLLRVCNGLVPHFHGGTLRGRAEVCGHDVVATPTRRLARDVGFVFQEPEAGFVRGTVAREVAFFPENLGLPPATIRRRVAAALHKAGIAGLAARRLRTLSGGERQRVALAAVLAVAPPVVVLDEPMSQLDAEGAAALVGTLTALAERGSTVVVAEHRLAGVPLGAARRVRLAGGQVAEDRVVAAAGDDPGAPEAGRRTAARTPVGSSAGPSAGPEVWSLRDVSVGVAGHELIGGVDLAGLEGEVVAVTGPNGSGKTTLLRTIAGLAPALSGRIERRPGRVAYLPQEPGLLLHRPSVRDEVDQTLRWTGEPGSAAEVLGLLGLAGLAGRDPRDLSGGQRQRAALAVVLAGRPALALLDEPTRGMDAAARVSLADALGRLAGGGAAVVVATHDVELARELGARVLRIEHRVLRPDEGRHR